MTCWMASRSWSRRSRSNVSSGTGCGSCTWRGRSDPEGAGPRRRGSVMKPGEILFGEGPIVLNEGRRTAEVEVTNASDHTIFVSSHFPFFEVNRRLVFDRAPAWGMHLDIPAGDSVRWRPGERQRVRLVAFGGRGILRGFNRLSEGVTSPERLAEGLERVRHAGYGHREEAAGGQ